MHEFFMTEKHLSVRIFPSVGIVNSAQLIFKKRYKNIEKKKGSWEGVKEHL